MKGHNTMTKITHTEAHRLANKADAEMVAAMHAGLPHEHLSIAARDAHALAQNVLLAGMGDEASIVRLAEWDYEVEPEYLIVDTDEGTDEAPTGLPTEAQIVDALVQGRNTPDRGGHRTVQQIQAAKVRELIEAAVPLIRAAAIRDAAKAYWEDRTIARYPEMKSWLEELAELEAIGDHWLTIEEQTASLAAFVAGMNKQPERG